MEKSVIASLYYFFGAEMVDRRIDSQPEQKGMENDEEDDDE